MPAGDGGIDRISDVFYENWKRPKQLDTHFFRFFREFTTDGLA